MRNDDDRTTSMILVTLLSDNDEFNVVVPTKRLKGKSYREAASNKVPQVQPPAKAEAIPSKRRMVMEVVIDIPRKTSRSSSRAGPPTSASVTETEATNSDVGRPRRRRLSKKAPIIISDDEEASEFELELPVGKGKGKRPARKAIYAKRSKKSSRSSDFDYEDSAVEETDSSEEPEESLGSSDDEAPKKLKGKQKQKSAIKSLAKTRGSSSGPATGDDGMDIDEFEPSSASHSTSKKRKAEDDGKRPAKKPKNREDTDPWKLKSQPVQKDWVRMQSPPLEMFHFARLVVDEYTYLDGKIHSMITNLTAERRWVLSGTPPIHDFGALKTISAFLNLHLGVDDDGEGTSAQVKKRKREQTGMFGYMIYSVLLISLLQLSRNSIRSEKCTA